MLQSHIEGVAKLLWKQLLAASWNCFRWRMELILRTKWRDPLVKSHQDHPPTMGFLHKLLLFSKKVSLREVVCKKLARSPGPSGFFKGLQIIRCQRHEPCHSFWAILIYVQKLTGHFSQNLKLKLGSFRYIELWGKASAMTHHIRQLTRCLISSFGSVFFLPSSSKQLPCETMPPAQPRNDPSVSL